jgi:hypothetical protein
MSGAVAGTPWPVKHELRQPGREFQALATALGLMARETGLEPATSGVTGRRSNQLSYSRFGGGEALGRDPICVKRVPGVANKVFW